MKELPPPPPSMQDMRNMETTKKQQDIADKRLQQIRDRGNPPSEGADVVGVL
jgi:hypothetical protein